MLLSEHLSYSYFFAAVFLVCVYGGVGGSLGRVEDVGDAVALEEGCVLGRCSGVGRIRFIIYALYLFKLSFPST